MLDIYHLDRNIVAKININADNSWTLSASRIGSGGSYDRKSVVVKIGRKVTDFAQKDAFYG